MAKHLLGLLCLVLPLFSISQSFEIDDINYQVTSTEDGTVEIIASPNATGAIDIPETVIHEDITYSVTTIGYEAFGSNGVTSVTIPDSVTAIGDAAFYNNTLKSVVIPDSVTDIGAWAFEENALTIVTIGNSVTDIGDAAFYNNAVLTWDCICIGSDFDGLITPIKKIKTITDLPKLRASTEHFIKSNPNLWTAFNVSSYEDIDEKVQKLFFENGKRFVEGNL